MRKLFMIALALLFVPVSAELIAANAGNLQEQNNQNTTASSGQNQVRRRHRRHRHRRGIGQSYKQAGTSTAQGGAGFGKNIARGKPIVAGRRLGKGVGRGGKRVGQGSAGVGRKVGNKTKDVVKPKQ
ncbi:MAG TPA: hypothetical protein VHD88_03755 [Pyrinomonadaceae bacterium]|nr:hypothetical protein [Pyrinomonadaceae bacterium]